MDIVEEYRSKLLLLAECNKQDHWKDEVIKAVEEIEAELRSKIEKR